MTALKVRRIRFDFRDPVGFLWNPENPAFSLGGNIMSIIAIGFERFIVSVIKEAMPFITDPAVAEEADAFLRQEAQHSSAHQQHLRALIRVYPGLKETLDAVIADYEELAESAPLPFKLAYIADIEATFTPAFKLVLDHENSLFRPGDDRIASLFLWHFVEEIEHRSSALLIYDAVVQSKTYRLWALPGVIRHMTKVVGIVTQGFEVHVPAEDRDLGPKMGPAKRIRNVLAGKVPFVAPDPSPMAPAFLGAVPLRDKAIAIKGILASQIPGHEPAHEALPAFADTWFARYEKGDDVVHWYWTERSPATDVPTAERG